MRQKPSNANSYMYELKIVTIEHIQPEEFLAHTIDRTGATTASGKMNYLSTVLRGEALLEFDELASQNAGTNHTHLKFIQEGLLSYFFD